MKKDKLWWVDRNAGAETNNRTMNPYEEVPDPQTRLDEILVIEEDYLNNLKSVQSNLTQELQALPVTTAQGLEQLKDKNNDPRRQIMNDYGARGEYTKEPYRRAWTETTAGEKACDGAVRRLNKLNDILVTLASKIKIQEIKVDSLRNNGSVIP